VSRRPQLLGALAPALLALLACGGLGGDAEPDAIALADTPEGEAHRDQPMTTIHLPTGAGPETPLPTLIWMHGFGADPWLADSLAMKRVAESRGVAVIGVSATLPMDDEGYTWSEDLGRDLSRLDEALAERADEFRPEPSRTVLMGFSQGAAVGTALAMAHPDRFAGAISLSPGSLRDPPVAAARSPLHESQGYVLRVGAGEHPSNVLRAQTQAREARAVKADVDLVIVDGQAEHTFPEGWSSDLGGWMGSILEDRGGLPELRGVHDVLREQAAPGADRMVRRDAMPEADITAELAEWLVATTDDEVAVVRSVVQAALAQQEATEAAWTEATDNDRLDRAFTTLQGAGIVARQDFADCGTCGGTEIQDAMEAQAMRGQAVRGYAFFHQQDTDAAIDGSGDIYLSYGARVPDGEGYEAAAVAIGREVAATLQAEGLEVDWDGSLDRRIGVGIDWRRRRFTAPPPR
jgi:predicted esterase